MATVHFTATCLATYESKLEIPDGIRDNKTEVLNYIRDHLPDANVLDIAFLDDIEPYEAVDIDDIREII